MSEDLTDEQREALVADLAERLARSTDFAPPHQARLIVDALSLTREEAASILERLEAD